MTRLVKRTLLRDHGRSGAMLVEVVVCFAVIGVVMLAALGFMAGAHDATRLNERKAFAVQRAIQMINEMRSFLETSGQDAATLDRFDDGSGTKPELTIQEDVLPDDPVSGNVRVRAPGAPGTQWQYARRINVFALPGQSARDVRLVSVAVFQTSNAQPDDVVLAEIETVIRTAAETFPPKQVYDLYLIAIENVPGWWVYMSNLVPTFQATLNDIQARNPNLELRVHWITKLAYGRNPQYVPYTNQRQDSTQSVPWVYYYPGLMPAGSAASHYYVPNAIKGRLNVDGVQINGYHPVSNPYPYTLADTYNNAMRYHDELALWTARYNAGLEAAPTLRLLMDDLHLNPHKYRNALFINLHGELLPAPPVRNYSDAAANPPTHPHLRVVTHPEKIRFRTTEAIRFRVHAYLSDPAYVGPQYPNNRVPLISVLIKGLPSTIKPSDVTLTRIEGGAPPMATDYNSLPGPGTSGDLMWAEILPGPETGSILLKLRNTPVKAPLVAGNKGLDVTKRLYGLEYIPCPTDGPNFTHGLHFAGPRAKNTARWIIQLPSMGIDLCPIIVETRIGDDLTTGKLFPVSNQPANCSRTYTWVSNNPEVVPFSERYQYIGDPRHLPYGDARANVNDLGYNWFFTDAIDSRDYSLHPNIRRGWDASSTASGAGINNVEVDVPRLFQFLREGLMKANALWTTITGYSYYYVGVGNEIGYDAANLFPNSIPVNHRPWSTGGATGTEQAILITAPGGTWGRGVKQIRGPGTWYARYWIGELYRDQDYATWAANGNLPAGTYIRQVRDNTNYPADIQYRAGRRTHQVGCGSFYNARGATADHRFDHHFSVGEGSIDAALRNELQTAFNYTIPEKLSANRPFSFRNSTKGHEWERNPYLSSRNNGSLLVTLYNHSRVGISSGILQIFKQPPNTNVGAIFAVNGISHTAETGSPFIARYSLISLLYAFLRTGSDTTPNFRIPQLPRVTITFPTDLSELNNPQTIDITWKREWRRWDGKPYSSFGTYTLTTTEPLFFVAMYSEDCGKTWKYVQDGTAAIPAQRPTDDSYKIDGTLSTVNWDVSALPEGSYYLRLECYRRNIIPHYSYHQQKIYIRR